MKFSLKSKVLAVISSLYIASSPVHASGIPVVDAASISQQLMGYIEQLSQGVQQVTAYTLQVKQYENELLRYDEMVKNRIAPAAYLYDRVNNLQNEFNNVYNAAENIKRKYGDFDAYLDRYGEVSFYSTSACFNGQGCNLEQLDDYQTRHTQAAIQKLNDLRADLETQLAALERSRELNQDAVSNLRSQIKDSDGALKVQQTLGDVGIATLQASQNTADEVRALRLQMAKEAYDREIMTQQAGAAAMAFFASEMNTSGGESWTDAFDNYSIGW